MESPLFEGVPPLRKKGGTQPPGACRWLVVVVVLIMTVLIMPVAVAVFVVIPMSLVQLPAFPIVVIVRVTPIGAFVGSTVPASLDPAVMAAIGSPISLYPCITRAGCRSTFFEAKGRWRGADVHGNLGRA